MLVQARLVRTALRGEPAWWANEKPRRLIPPRFFQRSETLRRPAKLRHPTTY